MKEKRKTKHNRFQKKVARQRTKKKKTKRKKANKSAHRDKVYEMSILMASSQLSLQ